ncbi:hypothetical protein FVE85_6061 [Porphyridium purpureum]|uniref:F-box domain-containing protein n=1 Tax=Porphyridium purpureum TaxID=35688 RepID=A0A5J4Z4A4_PORPP|nr:hypothetical protein FVE85_6061 [Porphyridium purpureum]|eukprot:POR3016..scf295_1
MEGSERLLQLVGMAYAGKEDCGSTMVTPTLAVDAALEAGAREAAVAALHPRQRASAAPLEELQQRQQRLLRAGGEDDAQTLGAGEDLMEMDDAERQSCLCTAGAPPVGSHAAEGCDGECKPHEDDVRSELLREDAQWAQPGEHTCVLAKGCKGVWCPCQAVAADMASTCRPAGTDEALASSVHQVSDEGSPDSALKLVSELEALLAYVRSKPALLDMNASFVRDYLRTLLMTSSARAQASIDAHQSASASQQLGPALSNLPEDTLRHVFGFLDAASLVSAAQVCSSWKELGYDHHYWRALCLKKWRALEYDEELWKLITRHELALNLSSNDRWRKVYPLILNKRSWTIRLQKTGRFVCNIHAHQLCGRPLSNHSMPDTLIVERRFNVLHLEAFVLPESPVLYFEPETPEDHDGFVDFIEYLTKRTRAGLALDEHRRFIFIPPCEYSRTNLDYKGVSMLGIVQHLYPPLTSTP